MQSPQFAAAAQMQAEQPSPEAPLFAAVAPTPLRQLWLDTGFVTSHFNRDKDLNGANRGLGLEYRLRADLALMGGRFYNSDRAWSNYLGALWQPVRLGELRLGGVAALFDGYPHMRRGAAFPALIPVASLDYQRVGVNIGLVPSYKDRLYGGIALQLKLKMFD